MVHKLLAVIALAYLLMVVGQGTLTTTGVGVLYAPSGGGGSIPGLVNFRGMPNAEAAFGSTTTNSCGGAADTYCTWYVDPVLSGNFGLVLYEYSNGSANTPTVTDDQSNTYTHCGTDAFNSTNNYYVGCFYKANITNAPRAVTVTWTAAVTNPSAATMQFYNATGVDGYSPNSGNGTTSFTAGSITASAANDMYIMLACGTSTVLNSGAWTLGSQAGITWLPDLLDRRDVCAVQHGVKTASGTLNPQITTATSNNFVALALALTAGSQGAAPTAPYIQHLYTVNSAATSSSPLTYQVPVAGNLIVDMNAGGDTVTDVSDSVNGSPAHWTSCGPSIVGSGHSNTNAYFYPNTATGVLPVSMSLTNTHDIGPASFYDMVGMATTQLCNRASPQATRTATGANYTAGSSYSPSASSGIAILAMSQDFDTTQSASAPTGVRFDANYVSGQGLDGPSYPDQNNGLAHYYFNGNTALTVTWGQASSSEMVESNSNEFIAFQAAGATVGPAPINGVGNRTSSGTTVSITGYTPKSGNLLAILTCANVSGTQSISDGGTNTYNTGDNKQTTNLNGNFCRTWYVTGATGSNLTITSTQPSGTFHSIMLKEYANVTTLDQHNIVANTSASNGTHTSSSFTTTSGQEAIFGAAICNNCDLNGATPPSGTSNSPWTQDVNDGAGNVAGHYIVSATGTYTVVMLENGAGAAAGTMAWMSFH